MRILVVCMGNICRSPTAEGVMRKLLRDAGREGEVEIDSAGTGGWHVGEAPDERAAEAARRRGIPLSGAARQVTRADFDRYDLIVAMDRGNERELLALAPGDGARAKVRLLREFDPASADAGELDVPDPYFGAANGFETVLDLVEAACRGLLAEIDAARR